MPDGITQALGLGQQPNLVPCVKYWYPEVQMPMTVAVKEKASLSTIPSTAVHADHSAHGGLLISSSGNDFAYYTYALSIHGA
jgi:hypothetical protein